MSDELFKAIAAGDEGRVQSILRESPELLRVRNEAGVSLVLWALYHGHQDVARLLVDLGAQLDIFDAAALGEPVALQQGLSKSPDAVASYSADGFTPLHLACFMGSPESVKTLLEGGADANALSRNG